MTRRLFVAGGLCLGVVLTLSGMAAAGQEKKGKAAAPKSDRLEGNVESIDKATKTAVVRLTGKTNTVQVVFSDKTSFTFRNTKASIDTLKEGARVICLGKFNDKNQLIATRIDVREGK